MEGQEQANVQEVQPTSKQEHAVIYYHTPVEKICVSKLVEVFQGREIDECATLEGQPPVYMPKLVSQKLNEKCTELHNKRITFAGVILPTDEVDLVTLQIGACTPNENFKENFRKKIGRNVARGRAIKQPMYTELNVPVGDVNRVFLDIVRKIKRRYVTEFYIRDCSATNYIKLQEGKKRGKLIMMEELPKIAASNLSPEAKLDAVMKVIFKSLHEVTFKQHSPVEIQKKITLAVKGEQPMIAE
jgi:hypothetical protein